MRKTSLHVNTKQNSKHGGLLDFRFTLSRLRHPLTSPCDIDLLLQLATHFQPRSFASMPTRRLFPRQSKTTQSVRSRMEPSHRILPFPLRPPPALKISTTPLLYSVSNHYMYPGLSWPRCPQLERSRSRLVEPHAQSLERDEDKVDRNHLLDLSWQDMVPEVATERQGEGYTRGAGWL